jgi:hypothetical protein
MRNKDARPLAGLDFILTNLAAQDSLKNVPRFIVMVVKVKGHDEARSWRSTSIALFGDDENIVDRSKKATRG